MKYRIKIVEKNDGKIIYYPQYNERVVQDLFSGLIIDFVTNWAFRWENFKRFSDDESLSSVKIHADTLEQAIDFIHQEIKQKQLKLAQEEAKKVKKTTYKYF